MHTDSEQFAQDPAAAQTLAWMREGRWRKARESAKELVKRERERYLPLLIEANVGLAREMLGKGLIKEATTVVDYLATLAPAALVATLRAELAAPVVKCSAASVSTTAEAAGWWAAVLRVEASGVGDHCVEDLAAVDLLVTDAFVPPVAAGDERAERMARELATVRAACAATGDGRWDAAREALQGLPRQSVFRYWRLFLRGVRCFFEYELDTAKQCFQELPPHGALARAARTFDPALVPIGPLAPVRVRVSLYLAATGQPAAWSGPIVAAAAGWKAGKRVEPFEELLAGMKGMFPAIVPGLPALLTEAALPHRTRMDREDYDAAETLMDRLGLDRGAKKLQTSEALLAFLRPMCLAEAHITPSGTLDRIWRTVIELWNRFEGPNPLRDAVAWQWLGEALSKSLTHADPASFFEPSPQDLDKARKAYEKAVEADPSNESAATGLLALLQRQGDTKAHKRLLDELLQRFPRSKSLLIAAAAKASKNKAFDKALVQLRAALAIDPLDKDVKCDIMTVLVLQTRELLRKKRPVAHQWAAMEPLLEDRPPRRLLMLSRWMARLRQALLDPDPTAALQAREDAVRLAPSTLERLLLENWLTTVYQISLRPGWFREWKSALKAGACDWANFTAVLDQHAFATCISGWGKAMNRDARTQVLEVLATLLGKNLKKDPDGLLAFLDRTAVPEKGITEYARVVRDYCMRDVFNGLDKDVDPSRKRMDIRLRMAALIAQERSGECFQMPRCLFLYNLNAVATEATIRGMPEIAARANALREKVDGPSHRNANGEPFGFAELFGDDDDDDEDYDDEDFDDDEDYDDGNDADFGGVLQLIEALEKAIENGDTQIISVIRKGLLECGLPEIAVNDIMQNLMAVSNSAASPPRDAKPKPVKPAPGKKPPPPPPPPAPAPAQKPTPPIPPLPDPNQLELF